LSLLLWSNEENKFPKFACALPDSPEPKEESAKAVDRQNASEREREVLSVEVVPDPIKDAAAATASSSVSTSSSHHCRRLSPTGKVGAVVVQEADRDEEGGEKEAAPPELACEDAPTSSSAVLEK